MKKWIMAVMLLIGMASIGIAGKDEAPRMAKDELKARLGAPDLVVIDVRRDPDWNDSSRKIAGAVREDPEAVREWAPKYPAEKTLLLYCA